MRIGDLVFLEDSAEDRRIAKIKQSKDKYANKAAGIFTGAWLRWLQDTVAELKASGKFDTDFQQVVQEMFYEQMRRITKLEPTNPGIRTEVQNVIRMSTEAGNNPNVFRKIQPILTPIIRKVFRTSMDINRAFGRYRRPIKAATFTFLSKTAPFDEFLGAKCAVKFQNTQKWNLYNPMSKTLNNLERVKTKGYTEEEIAQYMVGNKELIKTQYDQRDVISNLTFDNDIFKLKAKQAQQAKYIRPISGEPGIKEPGEPPVEPEEKPTMPEKIITDIEFIQEIQTMANKLNELYANYKPTDPAVQKQVTQNCHAIMQQFSTLRDTLKGQGKAPETEPEEKPQAQVKPEIKPEVEPEIKPEVKPQEKPEVEPKAEPEVEPKAEPEVKPEVKPSPDEIIRRRQPEHPDVVGYEVKGKTKKATAMGEMDEIIATLKGEKAKYFEGLAEQYSKANELKKELAEEEKQLKGKVRQAVDQLFDVADEWYTRVVETAKLVFKVAKAEERKSQKLDTEGYMDELTKLTGLAVEELEKIREKYISKVTVQVEPKVLAPKYKEEEKTETESVHKLNEGTFDVIKSYASKIKERIDEFLKQWDARFDELKSKIEKEL